ncbi:histidine kinase [Patulibacter minatonensis]|uniref:histidine kinase n=1 Tax=Patulibacter minatonensis TaxID=298163 RepID=UPI000A04241B|nr:histidine kinase [Patulibacter minatonensis]
MRPPDEHGGVGPGDPGARTSSSGSGPDADRGRHTVLLGMAPGVGKTYRALQDLRRARDAGRDAIVAVVETHGRAETALQVEGLEVLPRRTIEHRGIVQHELDLPGLLARAAGGRLLALVDELAHTNAPGTEHAKRWQDVDDALAAGIDVVSTVNVQHLESLNDQIMELTGVRVRETVPDRVLVDADDVVVVDLPPEALLQRLRDGQIYPVERVPAALNNFFRVERLTALRETALLQVAEEVGARRLSARPARVRDDGTGPVGTRHDHADQQRLGDDVVDAVRERVLVLVSANGSGQRVLRRAWRSARRLRAHVDVLHVQRPGRVPTAAEKDRLKGLRSLCGLLGLELLVVEDDDIDVAAARVARERGTTYIFVGVPRPPSGLRRAAGLLPPALTRTADPLPVRLWQRLPGVDVRIVADRRDRPEHPER